jgi:RNA polymerase sigma-70 factor (ECF subfamily)
MSEDDLMVRIADGDEASFNELYGMWSRRVMAYAFRTLGDFYEAQDIAQETFIQLYKSAPTYRGEGKFGAFLFRIAGNAVRGRFRKNKPPDSLDEILDDELMGCPESLQYSPEDSVINGIDIERLLGELPVRQKEALILVASGVSYLEGGQMLGISNEAFAQLVLRGRRALKMKLERDDAYE